MHVLFVCTGNTCRSPMAAGIFRKIVDEKNLKNMETSSAGIAADNMSPATQNAIEACKKINVDLSAHVSRSIVDVNLNLVDKFVVMTEIHQATLLEMGVTMDKIYVLDGGVLDPFGGSLQVYEACRDQIYSALCALVEQWCKS